MIFEFAQKKVLLKNIFFNNTNFFVKSKTKKIVKNIFQEKKTFFKKNEKTKKKKK